MKPRAEDNQADHNSIDQKVRLHFIMIFIFENWACFLTISFLFLSLFNKLNSSSLKYIYNETKKLGVQ